MYTGSNEATLGAHKKSEGLGAKCRMVEKEEVCVYIPILHTLQALLQNETVISEVSMKQITFQQYVLV